MKKLIDHGLIVLILVIILSPWWWIILQRNVLVSLLTLILSGVVYIYFWQTQSKKLLLSLFILTVAIFFINIKDAFDESIFSYSAVDIQQINKRHEFYANGLGKVYTNRIALVYFKDFSLPLYKLQQNFFNNIDINLYFFASHPRERVGIEGFDKYIPIFLPIFLIGIFYFIYQPSFKLLIYGTTLVIASSIIKPAYNLGPILLFPIINFMITIGIMLSLNRLLKYSKK